MNEVYLDTARLLTQVAPLVFVDNTFALKGGTAINLFIRDMPRLSVDLDLVFPDHGMPRDQALAAIGEALQQSADHVLALEPDLAVAPCSTSVPSTNARCRHRPHPWADESRSTN
jgi:hypothetical protein